MTVPREYLAASADFERFLDDLASALTCESTAQSYVAVRTVMHAFRDRLDPDETLQFASCLPTGLRALFVAEWEPSPRRPWLDRHMMSREIGVSAPDAGEFVKTVACVLARHTDSGRLHHALGRLAPQAASFWSTVRD